MSDYSRAIRHEFGRVAPLFAERTKGRFDEMDVLGFSRVSEGESVVEVGAGTGNFLALFAGVAGRLVAADLTPEMLLEGKRRHEGMELVAGDGARLPFRSRSMDLVTSAQALHHIREPVPFLREMRRVVSDGGRILVVDQRSPESFEQAAVMNELEVIRDPTHVATRPPSAFRIVLAKAGLEIVDERLWAGEQRLSNWMWPGEFPSERIVAVKDFIERFGSETGMDFRRDGDDWVFTRRRIMLLARRAARRVARL